MITDLDSAVRGMDSKLDFQREFADIFRKYIEIVDSKISTDNGTKLQVPGPQGQIAETKRRDFWCRTVIAYTGASNSVDSDKAITWADNCLKAFDERFNNK